MKNVLDIFIKKIIIFLIFTFLIFLIFQNNKVYANSYEDIDLNELNEIKDNQELLDTVINVSISYESDLSLVNILSKCNNLKKLGIGKATIENLRFINDIQPSNGFVLRLDKGYYNMEGISNPYIKEMIIDSSFITNFSKGMDVPNVERIEINSVSGYEDIDYSRYQKLEALSLWCITISDYKTFFEQLSLLNELKHLNLEECNITDEDMKFLKDLTNITSLDLKGCHIEDITCLKNMQQLTYLFPPIDVNDLSVIKELPNLQTIYWTGYEQLALTDDLVEYLDNNNISHNKYDSSLKNTLLDMIDEMSIDNNMSTKEKIEKVIDYTTNYVISHDSFYDETYSDNSLLYIVHFKTGVCNHYVYLQHALLKLIGVDTYYIGGLIPVYISELDGEFYSDELKYELAGHAWLMTQDENGLWYGWDPVQIDEGNTPPWDSINGKKHNFWKNPYEDDTYSLDEYQYGKYDSFNYFFAKKRNVTNKIGYNDYLNETKIIFNSNDENIVQSKQRVYKNKEFKLNKNSFIRSGYIFDSWNTKPDGTGIKYQDEDVININNTITLYAQWRIKAYTVQFDANGGNGIMEDKTDIIGQYIIPECEFTNINQNYEFDGWLIENENVLLKPGTTLYINKDIRLIAQWKEIITCTVSFNTEGGSSTESQIVRQGEKAIEPSNPIREGYKFGGWYEDSTYQFWFYFGKPITANVTLYAKWIPNDYIIKTIDIEVPIPTVGDVTTIEKYAEYWDWNTQKPTLNIKIADGANYRLADDLGAYMFWVTDFEDEMTPFIGTFEYDKDYYVRIVLTTKDDYFFDENMEIIVNGKPVDKVFNTDDYFTEIGVILTTPKKSDHFEYKILEGENQKYTISDGNDLKIKINGDLSKFTELKVDNVTVDPSNYYLISEMTVIALKNTYLDALSEGEHSLKFIYSDGDVTTKLKIAKSEANSNKDILNEEASKNSNDVNSNQNKNKNDNINNNTNNNTSLLPQTGDNIFVWVCLFIISFIGIIITTNQIRKE